MSKANWVKVTWAEFNKETPTKRVPHKFTGRFPKSKKQRSSCPWPYCVQCGLVLLRNAATEKAKRKLCEVDQ